MGYFDGVSFDVSDFLPECPYRMDTAFSYYAINLIRAGSFVFSAGNDAPVEQTDLPLILITAPGRRLRYGPGPTGMWEHYFVTFQGPRVEQWLTNGLMPELEQDRFWLKPVPDDPALVDAFMRTIHAVQNTPASYARAVHELEGLLLFAQELSAKPRKDPSREIIERHIAKIRYKPELNWNLEELGSEAGYSVSHYRRLFTEIATCSPSQLIRQRRMMKAAHLLFATREPIKVIATACGYEDVFHFSKQFKLEYGQSPGAFRKRS